MLTSIDDILYNSIIKRLITAAAAGLWSPLNNSLGFQIFLSFLSFFKTIGAGKIFVVLVETLSFTEGNLKHFSKTPHCRVLEKNTHTSAIKFIRYILDLYLQVGKDFLIN